MSLNFIRECVRDCINEAIQEVIYEPLLESVYDRMDEAESWAKIRGIS